MNNSDRANNERMSDVINPLLLQAFVWDMAPGSSHWWLLAHNAEFLAACGVSSIWFPPAYKGYVGVKDVGYGAYDMYDLGEFDQEGAVPAKCGTKDEYLAAVAALYATGVSVVADVIPNHRMGGEAVETAHAIPVDSGDRRRSVGGAEEIQAWTRYRFPDHGDAYSGPAWDWACFNGSDWDETRGILGVWFFEGKQWNENADNEFDNYDYLTGCGVNAVDPKVWAELDRWGCWYVETADTDGLRLGVVKHISAGLFADWLSGLRRATGRALPAVGEYWSYDVGELRGYFEAVPSTNPFDVPLHFHLHAASNSNGDVDLSRLFEGTLVDANPARAIMFVENHDIRSGQSLAFTVRSWFKPLVYAIILLREVGTPCVFWSSFFGTPKTDDLPIVAELPLPMTMWRALMHGPQYDAFDAPDVVGFVHKGDDAHLGSGPATVLSDRLAGAKRLYVGARHTGKKRVNVMGGYEPVVVGGDGVVELPASDGGLSVYVPESARPMLDGAKEYRPRVGSGSWSRYGLY